MVQLPARLDAATDPWRPSVLAGRGCPGGDYPAFVLATAFAGWNVHARITVHTSAAEVLSRINPAVGVVEAVDDHTCVLVTGADTVETVAVYIGMLGLDFAVTEPPELSRTSQRWLTVTPGPFQRRRDGPSSQRTACDWRCVASERPPRRATAKKCLGLPCGPAGIVVPPGEISDVLCAHRGRWRSVAGSGRGLEQCVPREVEGALHWLSPHIREATASLHDRTNEARPDYRMVGAR